MSEIANPTLGKAEDLFKSFVWTPFIDGLLTQHGLNWWPLSAMARLLTDKIFEKLRLIVDLGAISFVNKEHEKAFNTESVKLHIIAKAKGLDSPEYREAKERAKDALGSFVRYGASK